MTETKSIAIANWNKFNPIQASVVEYQDNPSIKWLVILWPDWQPIWQKPFYYYEVDELDPTYYYFWYLQVWWDRRRIRRINKSDYSVWWAVGDTDYATNWADRTTLVYNPTL